MYYQNLLGIDPRTHYARLHSTLVHCSVLIGGLLRHEPIRRGSGSVVIVRLSSGRLVFVRVVDIAELLLAEQLI